MFASRLDKKKRNQLPACRKLDSHFESSFATLLQPSFNCFIKSHSWPASVEEKNGWTKADLLKTFSSANSGNDLFGKANLKNKTCSINSFNDTSKIKLTSQSSLLFKPSKLSLTFLKTKNFFTKGRWSLH